VEPEVPIDLFVETPVVGDRYLLCSDGLPREVSDDAIASLLRRMADPGEAARALVEEAKRRGGNDNITVVIVDVVDDEAPPTAAAEAEETVLGPEGGDATTALPATADATTALAGGAAAPEPAPRRTRAQKRAAGEATASPITVRVLGFILLFLLILAAAAAAIVWYARSSYYVGLRGTSIVIYQGRPGGVLWFEPTLAATTAYTTANVLQVSQPALKAGQEEPSIEAARTYVQNLVDAYNAAQAAQAPPTTIAPTTTTTAPRTTTTRPRATTATTAKP
jgi:hypothetical protein